MGHTASHGQQTSSAFGLMMLGAMAGALAALLFAPKKGTEMRDDLRNRYNDTMDKTNARMDVARDKMRTAADKLRAKTHETADAAKDAADRSADNTERLLDETESSTKGSRKSM